LLAVRQEGFNPAVRFPPDAVMVNSEKESLVRNFVESFAEVHD
jgi:hypothetical protein